MLLIFYLDNVIMQSYNLALILVRFASMIESSSSQNCFIACNCKCFRLLLLLLLLVVVVINSNSSVKVKIKIIVVYS
jgi:hypothetical protein